MLARRSHTLIRRGPAQYLASDALGSWLMGNSALVLAKRAGTVPVEFANEKCNSPGSSAVLVSTPVASLHYLASFFLRLSCTARSLVGCDSSARTSVDPLLLRSVHRERTRGADGAGKKRRKKASALPGRRTILCGGCTQISSFRVVGFARPIGCHAEFSFLRIGDTIAVVGLSGGGGPDQGPPLPCQPFDREQTFTLTLRLSLTSAQNRACHRTLIHRSTLHRLCMHNIYALHNIYAMHNIKLNGHYTYPRARMPSRCFIRVRTATYRQTICSCEHFL